MLSREVLSINLLDANCRSVADDVSYALHQLSRIISNADYGVGSGHVRLHQHCVERLLASSFSEVREERDISAEQCLHTGADGAEHGARTNDNSAHDAEAGHDSVTGNVEARGSQGIGDIRLPVERRLKSWPILLPGDALCAQRRVTRLISMRSPIDTDKYLTASRDGVISNELDPTLVISSS